MWSWWYRGNRSGQVIEFVYGYIVSGIPTLMAVAPGEV